MNFCDFPVWSLLQSNLKMLSWQQSTFYRVGRFLLRLAEETYIIVLNPFEQSFSLPPALTQLAALFTQPPWTSPGMCNCMHGCSIKPEGMHECEECLHCDWSIWLSTCWAKRRASDCEGTRSARASKATRHVWGHFGLQRSVSIQRAYKGEVASGPFVIWLIWQAYFHYSYSTELQQMFWNMKHFKHFLLHLVLSTMLF